METKIFLVFVLTFALISSQKVSGPERIPCELVWVPDQDGRSPDQNIVAFNSDDIVARINLSGLLIPARLVPDDGKAYAPLPLDGSITESSTYEVLTNPKNCIITWEEPTFTQNNAVITSGFGIGRAHLVDEDGNFNTVGGAVVEGKELHVSINGKQEISQEFQILTSVYPLMHCHLYNFTIKLDQITPNYVQQIESETITNSGSDTTHEINHGGTIEQIFHLTESELEWKGISNLGLSLIFGNIAVTSSDPVIIPDGKDYQVTISQNRDLTFKKSLTLSQEGDANKKLLVCSATKIFIGEVQYEAWGRFESDGMGGEEIKRALANRGSSVEYTNGQSAVALVKGVIKGRFYMEKMTSVMPITDEGSNSCPSL